MAEIDILKKECIEYIKWMNEKDPTYFTRIKDVKNFCQVINENISDEVFKKLQNIYEERTNIINGKIKGNVSIEEIVDLAIDFLGEVSIDLQERFKSDLNNGLININPNNSNCCLYLTQTVNGKEINFNKVYVQYTGTIYDVIVLVHEYFHSLTDIIDYVDEINLNKKTIDYIQETVSIFAQCACSIYLSNKFPAISSNEMLYLIYHSVFISARSGVIFLRYINAVMGETTIEELNKMFPVSEIREILDHKKVPFSIMHFVGAMTSITKLKELDDIKETLNNIYIKIKEQKFQDICEDIPFVMNAPKVIEFINEKTSTGLNMNL